MSITEAISVVSVLAHWFPDDSEATKLRQQALVAALKVLAGS